MLLTQYLYINKVGAEARKLNNQIKTTIALIAFRRLSNA